MDSVNVPRKLWEHPNPKSTEMYRLMQEINTKHQLHLDVCLRSILAAFEILTELIDVLGLVPIFNHQTSPILGPSFPIPRLNLQWNIYDSG